jgi:hypothetical protein
MLLRLTFYFCLLFSSQAFASFDISDPTVRQWLDFMKYKSKNKTYQSPISNPAFFISQDGEKDGKKEFQATIETFNKILPSSDKHPQCVFPARYEILKQKFSLAPPVVCPNFDSWRKDYQITSVNVLYGSQFISTPTSAFGHAFFLIDSDTTIEYSRVTYNYGADIPADVGARLIIDGLFGGFRGTYTVIPLYHRLHSYNDIENRDIWEYTLALTETERDLLVKLLWEVQQKYSAPYYFLTGNCASIILDMLNIVRPGLDLKTSSPFYTSPQEIFRVLDRKKLIADVKYRPSLEKQLDQKLKVLSKSQTQTFKNIVQNGEDFPKDFLLAETVIGYVQLQRQKNQGTTPPSLVSVEKKALLARSQIPEASAYHFPKLDWPPPPQEAQGPNLLGIGRSQALHSNMTSVVIRPAFHDLMQTDAGFLPNSSIDVLVLNGRIPDGKDLRLETLTLGKIVNFREVKMYDPLATSWMVGGEVRRNPFYEIENKYFLNLSADFGFASQNLHPSVLLFVMLGFDARDGEIIPFGRFGSGPRLGAVATIGRIKAFLSYRLTWQSEEARTWQKREADVKIRYNLNQEWDFLAEFQQQETAHSEDFYSESGLSLRYSF